MNNLPKVKVGIVAVSRDCFPEPLSVNRDPYGTGIGGRESRWL